MQRLNPILTGPRFKVLSEQAVLFIPPKPKKINPYSQSLYYFATGECSTFDAIDCLLSQEPRIKFDFNYVRQAIHEKYLEYRDGFLEIKAINFDNKNVPQPLDKIKKDIIQKKEALTELVDCVMDSYKTSSGNTMISHEELEKFTLEFFEKGLCRPYLQKSISEKILTELKLSDQKEWAQHDANLKNLFPNTNEIILQSCARYNQLQTQLLDPTGLTEEEKWKPTSSIDEFINILKAHGLLLMTGEFNKDRYNQPPTKITVGKHQFFAYAKGAFREEKKDHHYTLRIVVVGASKKGYENTTQDLVYYIDPAADINIKDYPIYMMSYKNFCARLVEVSNGIRFASTDSQRFLACRFIYYHPLLKPMLGSQNSYCSLFWKHKYKIMTAALTVTAIAGRLMKT